MLKKKRRSEEALFVKNCSKTKKCSAVPKKKNSTAKKVEGDIKSENISFFTKDENLLYTVVHLCCFCFNSVLCYLYKSFIKRLF